MNIKRRQEIDKIKTRLEDLCQEIQDMETAEQDAFDNLPESLQQGERGQKMEEAIGELDSARDTIGEAIGNLETAMQQ